MSQFSPISSGRLSSRLSPARIALPALLLAGTLGMLTTGCGGGPGYVYAVGPCYGYGCGYGGGYGYGYGNISTFAGTGVHGNSGNGGAAVKAQLDRPVSLTVDPSGNLFIADSASNTVREVAASTGLINDASTASASATSSLRSSIASTTTFNHPAAIALDPAGNLYVLDQASSAIHRVSSATGTLALVAGSALGRAGFSGDNGQATSSQLSSPSGMAFDPSGNLFIADTGNHRIREVAASTGMITTLAGTGAAGFSGDGGLAAAAQLSSPSAVAVDAKGNLYIADSGTSTIRKIDTHTGLISTVAGTGVAGFSGDSAAATSAQLNAPQGITVDSFGNLFISDTGNQRVRQVAVGTGVISTIAGNSAQGYSGDGKASAQASLNAPYATAVDASGNLYIADFGNAVIRKVLPNPQTTQTAQTSSNNM